MKIFVSDSYRSWAMSDSMFVRHLYSEYCSKSESDSFLSDIKEIALRDNVEVIELNRAYLEGYEFEILGWEIYFANEAQYLFLELKYSGKE